MQPQRAVVRLRRVSGLREASAAVPGALAAVLHRLSSREAFCLNKLFRERRLIVFRRSRAGGKGGECAGLERAGSMALAACCRPKRSQGSSGLPFVREAYSITMIRTSHVYRR